MLVTLSIVGVVVSAVVGAYSFLLTVTARTVSVAAAGSTASGALEAMQELLEGAHACTISLLPNGSIALLCSMPDSTAYNQPAPFRVDTFGVARYAAGETYAFYNSDATGSFTAVGNALWRARAPAGSVLFTPDATWSLYYDTKLPRYTALLDKDRTKVDATSKVVTVTLCVLEPRQATAISRREAGQEQRTVTRTYHYRNFRP